MSKRRILQYHLDHPVEFLTNILGQNPSPSMRVKLLGLECGEPRRRSIGLSVQDVPIAAGIVTWRAVNGVPTILWGGRPAVRRLWVRYLAEYMAAAELPFSANIGVCHDFTGIFVATPEQEMYDAAVNRPLVLSRAEYAFGGPDSVLGSSKMHDVLISDLEWCDKETIQHANQYTQQRKSILTVFAQCPSL